MSGAYRRDADVPFLPSFLRLEEGIAFAYGPIVARLVWEREDVVRIVCLPSGRAAFDKAPPTFLSEMAGLASARSAVEPPELPEPWDGPMLDPARPKARVDWKLAVSERELAISSSRLRVVVDRSTGALSYYDGEGRLLVREPRQGGGKIVERLESQADRPVRPRGPGGGELRSGIHRCRIGFEFAPDEAIYGLGQQEQGRLDRRGLVLLLYQHNLKIALPVLISSRGWGLLAQAYGLLTFRDDVEGSFLEAGAEASLEYFVIAGPEPDAIVRGFRHLTGQAALPPRWAFGYVQSKERYASQEELLAVAREFRERGLPLDCIVLDWLSWEGELWGQKSLDPVRFPDARALTKGLHELGVKLMVSVWPSMKNECPDQLEMRKAGFLLGDGSTYDAFDPEARALFWERAKRGLWDKGIDAWWCDSTEPFDADWSGAVRPSPEERLALYKSLASTYLDPGELSAYSLFHSRGIWEGQRAAGGGKRVLNLTRSAYPGQQRYGTFSWSGDVVATWETLRRQIAEGLSFCLSGLPFWTTDIGGFFTASRNAWFWHGDFDRGCDDPGYRELFLRWFQFGTFLPMFRAHGTDTPREPWRYGDETSRIGAALRRCLSLRYRLLPYIYSLAGSARLDGSTMMRALVFDFREDERALRVEDQFMFGPALMACPVTRPQGYGPGGTELRGVPESREVWLPGRGRWQDFWTGEVHDGGRRIDAAAPLEIIPLFVRAGSILPLAPESPSSEPSMSAPWELRVYPGADGSFVVYEDAGDGWGYEVGEYSRWRVEWRELDRTLVIGAREGLWPGMPARRVLAVRVMDGGGGDLDGPGASVDVVYEGSEIKITL